jgi:hypothetical protein
VAKVTIDQALTDGFVEEFEHRGLRCVVRLNAVDAPCGYVLFDSENEYAEESFCDVPVHGGVTFFRREGSRYTVGFDMAHDCDMGFVGDRYACTRTVGECERETVRLADGVLEVLAGNPKP